MSEQVELVRLAVVRERTGLRWELLQPVLTDAIEYAPGKIRFRFVGQRRRYVRADLDVFCGKTPGAAGHQE